MRFITHSFHVSAVMLGLFGGTLVGPLTAQEVPPPGTSTEEIRRQIDARGLQGQLLERMRTSGMTPDQVRRMLAQRGYDPTLLDPYLDEDEDSPPEPGEGVLSAVNALRVLEPRRPDSLRFMVDSVRRDSIEPLPDSSAIERERGLRVFGLDVFRRRSAEFQPVTAGPVPPGYVVGPGDQLVLILTGDVEASYTLSVTREGFVVIPQVGQVWVNGLTVDEIRDQLYTHLGRAFSGISRSPDSSTRFQLSLGQLRPTQLFVTGQVTQPGTYMVSALASALNVLYLARGPTPNGSFRDVRIMRNGELVRRLDLYDYLLGGDNFADMRLDPGDVIFVPAPGTQVSITGEVATPAIYELDDDETLLDLIRFAGGLNAPAHLRRARIERILPPDERTVPGVDRVVIDVDLGEAMADPASAPRLQPGDAVRVFAVRPELRNTVSIRGAVWADSGSFRLTDGMRLWDLIDQAGGLQDDAYTQRAQIARVDPRDSTLAMIPVSLQRDAGGSPVDNPELREFDAVRVFDESEFTTSFPVSITGDVRSAVRDTFQEGMTLRDLILRAGGLRPTADLTVEIARLARPDRTDRNEIAEVIQIRVDSTYFVSGQDRRHHLGGVIPDDGPAAEFLLQPYDRVRVRSIPDLEFQRSVELRGEIRYPGQYSLQRKDERLSQLLERAGGLTTTAYPGGFRLYRDTTLVNVDLADVLRDPRSSNDIVLLPDDSIFIPEYNPVVLVQGAVNATERVAVVYREGASLDYYINQAGGYARFADRDNVNIRYANGEGAAVDQFLIFKSRPEPLPGSTIIVPALRDEDRINWPAVIGDVAQVAGTLTTIVLLIARL